MSAPRTAGTRSPRGWLLYDGDCGTCARGAPLWAPTLRGLGLGIAPLQAPWVAARLGLAPATLSADIRIVFADGGDLAGAAVYRWVMRRVWWAYPLYLLSVTPGLRGWFDRGYRAVADHRMGLARVCGLAP